MAPIARILEEREIGIVHGDSNGHGQRARDLEDNTLIDEIWLSMDKLNRQSQSHARILRNMLVPMQFREHPLEKSSKGTILRGRAEDRYRSEIEPDATRTVSRSAFSSAACTSRV